MPLTGLEEGRSNLGRTLLECKALSPDWTPSFAAVPRAAFLPDVMWPYDMDNGTTVAVNRREDPAMWQSFADSDDPIVTQWDDGGSSTCVPTSSSSMPSVVFRMLRDLDVRDGHRVLEAGTGTGWTAALLAHRLGAGNVVSIEIDPEVAAAARQRLAEFGSDVQVLTRDGTLGDPDGAPYDRIAATFGLRRIPAAWLGQTRPGGLIVAPWGTDYSNEDAVARLVVADDGRSASGTFTDPVEFMKARDQRREFDGHQAYVPDGVAGADRSTTAVTEAELLGQGRFDARTFVVGLRVRDCYRQVAARKDGARPVWFYGLTDRSWACVMFRKGEADATVWQSGPRSLWEEVVRALRWWQEKGEPGYDRLGLTVTFSGAHHAWLDTPDDAWQLTC
ncbi:methyltransferase domain-containing protein [Streptomyces acidiscabies]|uniref:methyltransferase domain-containing protein n=1 Tax=Streptomyces acidiscabies TaxID=42234 RepID=UPI0038F7F3DD